MGERDYLTQRKAIIPGPSISRAQVTPCGFDMTMASEIEHRDLRVSSKQFAHRLFEILSADRLAWPCAAEETHIEIHRTIAVPLQGLLDRTCVIDASEELRELCVVVDADDQSCARHWAVPRVSRSGK